MRRIKYVIRHLGDDRGMTESEKHAYECIKQEHGRIVDMDFTVIPVAERPWALMSLVIKYDVPDADDEF